MDTGMTSYHKATILSGLTNGLLYISFSAKQGCREFQSRACVIVVCAFPINRLAFVVDSLMKLLAALLLDRGVIGHCDDPIPPSELPFIAAAVVEASRIDPVGLS